MLSHPCSLVSNLVLGPNPHSLYKPGSHSPYFPTQPELPVSVLEKNLTSSYGGRIGVCTCLDRCKIEYDYSTIWFGLRHYYHDRLTAFSWLVMT